MEIVERFRKAYEYLYNTGIVHTKKDLAEKMKVSRGSVQNAYAGNESYLNESFMRKLERTFPGIFNMNWLLSGEGEMLQEKSKPAVVTNSSSDNISLLLEQNKELIGMLKKSLEDSQRTNNILLNELSELRKELKGDAVASQKTIMLDTH